MMMNDDDDNDGVDDAIAMLGRLGIDNKLVNVIRRTLDRRLQTMERLTQEKQFLRGEIFCATGDVLQGDWQPYVEADYTSLVRDWNQFQERIESINPHAAVLGVYQQTRDAAGNQALVASESKNITSITGVSPVRLCSFPNSSNFIDRAHLCPKTSTGRKTDTWIYVAAAVLGMNRATANDRDNLVKALCGSCEPDKDVKKLTGLNRSPFNLILFANQRTWYDQEPGVLVLPVMTSAQARDWDGRSYEVLIICSSKSFLARAPEIATSIGLTTTDHALVQHATATDISSAVSLLSAVVKASAFCLENLPAPSAPKASVLWSRYRNSLQTARDVVAISGGPGLLNHVVVPTEANIPEGKFVAKVDLAQMTTSGDIPAYPDPLQLVYKSSVNWTRMFGFQLIAEAEPPDLPSVPPRLDVLGLDLSVHSEITQES
jgi:hypothetical protein